MQPCIFLTQLYQTNYYFFTVDGNTVYISNKKYALSTQNELSIEKLESLISSPKFLIVVKETNILEPIEFLSIIKIFLNCNLKLQSNTFTYSFILEMLSALSNNKIFNDIANFVSKNPEFSDSFFPIIFSNFTSTEYSNISFILKHSLRKTNNILHFKNILIIQLLDYLEKNKKSPLQLYFIQYIEKNNLSAQLLHQSTLNQPLTNIFSQVNDIDFPNIFKNLQLIKNNKSKGIQSFPFFIVDGDFLKIPINFFQYALKNDSLCYFIDIFLMFSNTRNDLSLFIQDTNLIILHEATKSEDLKKLSTIDLSLYNSEQNLLIYFAIAANSTSLLWKEQEHIELVIKVHDTDYIPLYLKLFNHAIYDTLMNCSFKHSTGYHFYNKYSHQLESDYLESKIKINHFVENITKF